MAENMQDLIQKLKDYGESCEDLCMDLKSMKFHVNKGEVSLAGDGCTYYFKKDPKNPKDPKVVHALKQFCKIVGVPFNFMTKNPDYMKENIMSCWLPSLKTEKGTVLAKLRRAKEGYIIRALLPVDYTNISNLDIVQLVLDAVGDSFRIEFAIGDDRDELVLHIRLISKETFEACGETCSYGFSVVASELGASPLCVDTLLFREESKSSILASYGGNESFFMCDYAKIQPNELKELFPKLIDRLKNQLQEIKELAQSAKSTIEKEEDVNDLLKELRLMKGLSDKFHTLLFQEVKTDDSINNRWDLSGLMSSLAVDFDVKNRIKIEKAAGNLIGLRFAKV